MARAITAAALMGAIMTVSGPSAAAPPLRFACTVSGEKLLVPPVTAAAVCERMRASLGKASGLPLRLDPAPPGPADRGWIRVALTFTKAGIATARLETASRGRVAVHPDVNIAVSDRAIGLGTVDMLARELAKRIDRGAHRS